METRVQNQRALGQEHPEHRECRVSIPFTAAEAGKDTNYSSFGAAAKEHKRLFYNDVGFLLAMALADGALVGYDTYEGLRHQIIPEGKDELILRFKQESLDGLILRKCTKAGGVTDESMTKSAFCDIFKSTLINAGYFCGASVHAIRHQLGKEVDSKYLHSPSIASPS